jgi:sulfur-oxidizing protein SoxY
MKRRENMAQDGAMATRREVLAAGAGLVSLTLVAPASATTGAMAAAIRAFTGGKPVTPGGIVLEIPALVENGNAVPLAVRVESAMSGNDFARSVAVFNEKNPQPNVCVFHFSAMSGRAAASTRIRLGDSQTILAIAAMADGTFRSASAELVVTLPACAED